MYFTVCCIASHAVRAPVFSIVSAVKMRPLALGIGLGYGRNVEQAKSPGVSVARSVVRSVAASCIWFVLAARTGWCGGLRVAVGAWGDGLR
jgi:hypothetical protein